MKTADEYRRQCWALDGKLGELGNLNALLQMVAWNAAQISAEHGSEVAQLRDAVVGLAHAIDEELKKDAYDLATGAA